MSSEEIKAEYTSSLADLTFNSKPLINVLTMLADENIEHASDIVEAVETHLTKVQTDVKLPILYLIDCIVKNVGGRYTDLFSQNIVATFCSVFRSKVNEKTRAEMFKLRQTWNEVFSPKKLYAIDVQIRLLDPAWPITAQAPSSIHLNPKFLNNAAPSKKAPAINPKAADPATLDMQQKLLQKQKELLELQQKKVELELIQTRVKLQEQYKGGNIPVPNARPQNILLKPEVAKQLLPPSSRGKVQLEKSANSSHQQSAMGHRSQQNLGNSGTRIAPVNSALLAAAATRPANRDPRLARQQANNTSNVHLESKNKLLDSNKQIVNNKQSVRDIRSEPRLVTNKDNSALPQKTGQPEKTRTKSRTFEKSKSRSKGDDSKSLSKSSSNSSLDSPSKKSDKSPSKSPSSRQSKKRETQKSSSKRDVIKSATAAETAIPTFKSSKGSKNRNYIRRNRSPSPSNIEAVPQDVDLRLAGPPEKQARLLGDPIIEKPTVPQTTQATAAMDVDLRQLPPAIIGKKRSSTEASEGSSAKKTKTEMFDVLFGNEDTDLRTLNIPTKTDRPPTPPPPIISLSEPETTKEKPPKKTNLAEIRAKLANTTIMEKLKAKSFHKKHLNKDQDLRINKVSSSSDISDRPIIISAADEENIKAGKMTKEQEQQLMNKIIAQIENQKLKIAQKQDKETTDSAAKVPNDEEIVLSDEETRQYSGGQPGYGDRDERVKFMRGRGGPNWRGARGARGRYWEQPMASGGMAPLRPTRPWGNNWRPMGPNFRPSPQNMDYQEIEDSHSPDSNDIAVESASQEDIKTMNIDGSPKEIRYYDETAVVFVNWDDPREIYFQDNGTRRIWFDETMYVFSFNEPYREITIGNEVHKARIGGPSREIYVDSVPYECFFGGPPITIDLNGKNILVKLDGPPPQVKIGEPKTDLVAGKVNLIVDAKTIIPVFLDAKVQKFSVDGEVHTLQFIEGLKAALINDVRFDIQFGGLPKPFMFKDHKKFIRFSVLPKGVRPGKINVKGLECEDTGVASPRNDDADTAVPAPLIMTKPFDNSPDNSNSNQFFQNAMQQQGFTNLDFLSNVLSSSMDQGSSTGEGYQVGNSLPFEAPLPVNTQPAPTLPSPLNINDLFQKLVATGIVTSGAKEVPPSVAPQQPIVKKKPFVPRPMPQKIKKQTKFPPMRYVSFNKPETLKIRQVQLYGGLYLGMQCSSCGMRFPPEQTTHYSQHLDWHFRQNRKGKKSTRVATSRRWYYTIADWKNYEEIEDIEEREKNFFDEQQTQAEGVKEDVEKDVELPSVTADPELQDICEVCGDKLETFFNEEKEEWHFKNAIRVEDIIYHPVCYEDNQAKLLALALAEKEEAEKQAIILDDDEQDTLSQESKEEPEVLIDSDESKTGEAENQDEPYDPEDDDVILHEEKIEKIILDDDDDDEQERKQIATYVPTAIVKKEVVDDGFMDIGDGLLTLANGAPVKVKAEPVDKGYEANEATYSPTVIEELDLVEEDEPMPVQEKSFSEPELSANAGFASSIDGNVKLDETNQQPGALSGKIKINLSKPLPVVAAKENKDINSESDSMPEPIIDPSQPLPPGQEPVLLNLKPALQGLELKKNPPVNKGSELTGMCSIM